MFEYWRNIWAQVREIRTILREERDGTAQARREAVSAVAAQKRAADLRAYRREIERAFRRKPDMTFAELRRRFPVGDERCATLSHLSR